MILFKGDTYTVGLSASLLASGWIGGQGIQWTTPTEANPFMVTASDGLPAGFFLWGSNEVGDRYNAMTGNQVYYGNAVIGAGGWLIATIAFERYTWASRQIGPLVEIPYAPSDRLVLSLRGYFTREDEWSLSGDPRAPNDYYIAFVVQAPTAANGYYITVQVSI